MWKLILATLFAAISSACGSDISLSTNSLKSSQESNNTSEEITQGVFAQTQETLPDSEPTIESGFVSDEQAVFELLRTSATFQDEKYNFSEEDFDQRIAYVLVDFDSGEILDSHNETIVYFPLSTTKLFTLATMMKFDQTPSIEERISAAEMMRRSRNFASTQILRETYDEARISGLVTDMGPLETAQFNCLTAPLRPDLATRNAAHSLTDALLGSGTEHPTRWGGTGKFSSGSGCAVFHPNDYDKANPLYIIEVLSKLRHETYLGWGGAEFLVSYSANAEGLTPIGIRTPGSEANGVTKISGKTGSSCAGNPGAKGGHDHIAGFIGTENSQYRFGFAIFVLGRAGQHERTTGGTCKPRTITYEDEAGEALLHLAANRKSGVEGGSKFHGKLLHYWQTKLNE